MVSRGRRTVHAGLVTAACVAACLQAPAAAATPASSSVPVVSGVSPASGPLGGGTAVTISGSGFTGATAVAFGTEPAASFTVVNGRTIHADSPAALAGAVQIVVSNSVGPSSPSSGAAFSYVPLPSVTGLSPGTGAETGGNTVTISGTGFTGATEVAFGSATTTDFTVWSATTITTFAPAGAVGTVNVTVVTPGGTSPVARADRYTYSAGTNPGYHVSGNQVVAPNGSFFLPRGSIVPCLAYVPMNDSASHTNCGKDGNATNVANIRSLASAWHANDVRIQVAQENLFDESPYDASYLALVDSEVQLVNSLGMVATITLQEEVAPGGPVFPVASSVTFWNFMAQHFENNPMVMFDLFNEPHLSPYALSAGQTLWNIWRNGGFVDDESSKECTGAAQQCVDTTFVGQQTLLTDIRADGADNIVIAEGTHDDQDLTGIPRDALDGSNLVYGIEPNLYTTTTETAWAADYGDLHQTYPIFGESLVVFNASALCNAEAPTLLPAEFQYMQAIGMGSLVWGMVPGDLTTSSPSVPTTYEGVSRVTCTSPDPGTLPGPSEPTNTIGPGADAIAFFTAEQSGVAMVNPAITRVGPATDGAVTITGRNLTNATDVTFGGADTPDLTVVSSTELQATVPLGGEGTDVEILTTTGSTTVTIPAAPGGVTVHAGNGSATVSFDPVPGATSYTVTATDETDPDAAVQTASGPASPLTVTGLTNGDGYTVAVSATDGIGTGAGSSVADVMPVGVPGPPTVNSVVAGAGEATVSFTPPTSDGGTPVASYTVTATDQTDPSDPPQTVAGPASPLTVTGLTNGDDYTVTVSATNGAGTGPDSAPFAGVVPSAAVELTLVDPDAIPVSSTAAVQLSGEGFAKGMTLKAGSGITFSDVTVQSPTNAEATVQVGASAAPGGRTVTVTVPAGSAACTGCLTVDALPKLNSVAPAAIASGAAGTVRLKGQHFQPGVAVTLGRGITATVVTSSVNGITLHVAVPSEAAPGAVTLTVINPDGGSVTCASCFSIATPPSLGSISVRTVTPGESTSVTLSGTGFAAGLKITGPKGVSFSRIDVQNPTTVTARLTVAATAPDAQTGAVTITNDNAGGDGSVTKDVLNVS